jgi:serine/threonine protein kinase
VQRAPQEQNERQDMNPGLMVGLAGSVAGVGGGLIGTYFSIKNTKGPRARAFVIKVSVLCWSFVLVFVLGMCLIPGLYKLFLIPVYFIGLVAGILRWNMELERISLEESKKNPAALSTQIIPRKCPQCGAELKPDLPEGLCPACLLQRGIATDAAPPGQPPFTPPPLAQLAKLFPQLEILEPIGKGGMGAVYKARQPALDRFVALKILAPRSGSDSDFASRFAREARALAKLNHPNIVGVYDFGATNGLNYFIMEYVDGPNLRQIEQAGKLSPREALQIIPQICAALQFAHDEGIVHRDIKPENVLVDKKGRVKIADFGLAKILGHEPQDFRLTGARDVMGTPHYMAPEQLEKPQEVDHRADIYSLGVVFYEMLTGELPLGKFQPPSSCARGVQVDVRLDEVVLRALAKEPERRYQHISEVKTRVETIAATPGGSGRASAQVVSGKSEGRIASAATQFSITFFSQIIGVGWFLFFCVTMAFITAGCSTSKVFRYFSACFLIFALVATVDLFFRFRRAIKTKTPEALNAAKSLLLINGLAFVVGAFLAILLVRQLTSESDYIGPAYGPKGDSIEITSVERNKYQMAVRGRYNLVSADSATLALNITSTNTTTLPEDPKQTMQISKGRGDFVLSRPCLVPGLPHVVMYSKGRGIAVVYFGTKEEVLEESKIRFSDEPPSGDAAQLTQEGWQLLQAQRRAEAAAKFNEAVKLDPKDADAWNGLGWAQFNSGKTAEAEKTFQKAISLEPDHPAALNGLGQIYLSQRKYDQAEEYLLKAAPQGPAAWFGLARLYLLQGKFDQARKWAQQVVDSGQGDDIARQMLQAAQASQVSEGLRFRLEPPPAR